MAFHKLFHFLHAFLLVFLRVKVVWKNLEILIRKWIFLMLECLNIIFKLIFVVESFLRLRSFKLLVEFDELILFISKGWEGRAVGLRLQMVKRLELGSAAKNWKALIIRINWILLLYITVSSLYELLLIALLKGLFFNFFVEILFLIKYSILSYRVEIA